MDKPKKISALVPAYQAADFIRATLDSLSAQTYLNFEVIVSVDPCDDDTLGVCLEHARKDARFLVLKQSERLGYVGNCNFLLGQSNADYVLFAFHDDILAPSYIAKLAEVLDQRPEVVMCYSDVLLTAVDGSQEHWIYAELDGLHDRIQRGMKLLAMAGQWWVPNRGLFRREDAARINGLKSHGAGEFAADWPWLFHMSLLGEFVRIPETLCYKFYKPGSLSRSWAYSKQQYYEAGAACMRELWNSELSSDEKLKLAVPLVDWLAKLQALQQRELDSSRIRSEQALGETEVVRPKTVVGRLPLAGMTGQPWRFF